MKIRSPIQRENEDDDIIVGWWGVVISGSGLFKSCLS